MSGNTITLNDPTKNWFVYAANIASPTGNLYIGNSVVVSGNLIVTGNITTPASSVTTLSAVLTAGNSAGSSQINMNSNKIINTTDPTNLQDVATKNYTDTTFKANKVFVGNSTATTANKAYYLDASANWILASNSNSIGKWVAVSVGSNSLANGMFSGSNPADLNLSIAGSIGSTIFLSSVAGEFTTTQPSGSDLTLVRPMGYKISSTNIIFIDNNNTIMPAGLGQYGISTGAGSTGFTSTTITDPISSLSYTLLRYTSTSGTNTMSVSTAGLFELFILGGGGGGGNAGGGSGGGGGAGQLVKNIQYLEIGAYTIYVGAGGAVGIAGGSATTRSAFRGGFSAICPTNPNYPKIVAVGGGGGMASNAGGGNVALNSYARTTWACASYCGGGGAGPQTASNETTDYSSVSPTSLTSLNQIGFSDNTLTIGGFFGGSGVNDSNNSGTGGGGGIGGVGGDATSTLGGTGGLGLTDGFSGVSVGYGGGGCGGHSSTQAIRTSSFGGGSGCRFDGSAAFNATAGAANRGGGGGGGANQNNPGGSSGAGGSGVVMVRFRI